jgi:hypothetical protein
MTGQQIRMRRLVVWVSILSLTACAHLGDRGPAVSLESRVAAHWQAKVNRNWREAYTFLCRAYRSQISEDSYVSSSNLRILAFQVAAVEMDPEGTRATVTVRFDVDGMGITFKDISFQEEWINEARSWYLCPKPGGLKRLFEKNS